MSQRPIRNFEQVESTNDIGLAWLKQGAPEGALVVADVQTKGRGRLGRTWFASPGTALLFTYCFHAPRELAVRATMLGALAVAESLRERGVRGVGVKYPNDVQIARRKVCGVLAEAAWGEQVAIALGIGVNVRVDFAGTPYAETAVSLETALIQPVDRLEQLAQMVARLDFWRARLGTGALPAAWRSSLNMLGEWVEVHTGSERVMGFAEDVTADGALIVRDRHGTRREVWAGDLLTPGAELPTEPEGSL
ncbi:MAG TPA: biotin--[acetyl-CoA-carboxylase] ligase [Candidatus Limnocylindrales bacterium]|nr:biotin--[acetyl-CoA-carboxylase] ligase [Candidatus Limnocylindrales bacterium]